MRVLVCGSRTYGQILEGDPKLFIPVCELKARTLIAQLNLIHEETRWRDEPLVIIEGGASGADAFAAEWAENNIRYNQGNVVHEMYPADWATYGKAAGPMRNRQMLESGVDLCLAFTDKPLEKSKGTANMVSLCMAAEVPIMVFQMPSL